MAFFAVPLVLSADPPASGGGAHAGGGGDGGQPGDTGSGGGAQPGDSGTDGGSQPGDTGDTGSGAPSDSQKGYYISVSLADQVVHVYLDGEEIKAMICSAGTAEKPTPTGRFHIQNRGEFFFSEKYQQGGKWWVSFKDWGIYLFHSVPTDKDGNILEDEAAKLGQPASHGCIRLAVENARWIYDNIPEGAPVDIQ